MITKLKNLNAWKKLTISAVLIILAALIVCLRWTLFYYLPYAGYSNGFELVTTAFETNQYEKKVGEFSCEVHNPSFLSGSDFIAVRSGSFAVTVTPEGGYTHPQEPDLSLFIWPSVLKGPKYGLMINFEKRGISQQSIITFTKNKDGGYDITHSFAEKETIDVFNEYKSTVEEMLKCADELWSFDGMNDIIDGWKVKTK